MIKISTILLFLSIGICSARVQLRDPAHWNNWNNIDLLNAYMGGFKFGSGQVSGDNYLNKLAQTVAETEESQIRQVISTFPKTSDNLIVFGFTFKGDTTYKQILTEDFNGIII